MSPLSLAFGSNVHGLSRCSAVVADRQFEMAEAAAISKSASIRDGEASRFEDCTLPAGIASMEHWLDLNA